MQVLKTPTEKWITLNIASFLAVSLWLFDNINTPSFSSHLCSDLSLVKAPSYMFMIFSLHRPDVLPVSGLGLGQEYSYCIH
ncbi:hypothetical protein L2E82_36382 [Cichorium intybus]|uniref:Uncharacterized protein n=1 Tax=Cichorium intybus TaxID=13427 RepID=A0ACB9BRR6_CICIN|nr:hypothetical protein L2E82_36382 [Cichorium intybus]